MNRNEARLYVGSVLTGESSEYTIGRLIGFGGQTGVFHAVQAGSGREVAVKVLGFEGRSPHGSEDFGRELALLDRLAGCPNVVTLLDRGCYEVQLEARGRGRFPVQVPFMVLDRAVTGFHGLLKGGDQAPWRERMRLYRDIVAGVQQMHAAGYAHRDIKASNCLVYDAEPCGRITDVGVGADIGGALHPPAATRVSSISRGDPLFAPPELLWGHPASAPRGHLRVDLYLLGSLLYECATAKGITAAALGGPERWPLLGATTAEDPGETATPKPIIGLRSHFDGAYAVFSAAVPRSIAEGALALLRQLTDPDPALREPVGPHGEVADYGDLRWLLERVDGLVELLPHEAGGSAGHGGGDPFEHSA